MRPQASRRGRSDTAERKGLARANPLLLGLVAAAAILRFAGIGDQAYWGDEAHTAFYAGLAFDEILPRISDAEGTPPLYYLLVWPWMKLFGNGEVAVRTISALAGVATVPVTYLAAMQFVPRRAAFAAAALVAVSPLLIWYSQEARAYELAALLGALSLLAFGRALREPSRGRLAVWAVVSGAAIWTQYSAGLLVAPEAVWLLLRAGAWRRVLIAVLGVGAIAVPALLLLREQNAGGATPEWIKNVPRDIRFRQVPEQFLLGYGPPHVLLIAAGMLGVVLAFWLLARRASAEERRRAALPGAIGVAVIAPLLALAAVPSLDYFVTRNVLLALVPLAIVVAAGVQVGWEGRALRDCLRSPSR
jgi:mannosyltransferase